MPLLFRKVLLSPRFSTGSSFLAPLEVTPCIFLSSMLGPNVQNRMAVAPKIPQHHVGEDSWKVGVIAFGVLGPKVPDVLFSLTLASDTA